MLFKLFPKHEFVIPKAVYEELMEAIRHGATFLHSVLALVDSGQIRLLSLTPEEARNKTTLPQSFGPGELEGVVICARRKSIFLTNDKRVRNYCQEHGIEVYDLVLLLRTLWRKGVLSKRRVQKIVSDIERLEKTVFKNRSDIFRKYL